MSAAMLGYALQAVHTGGRVPGVHEALHNLLSLVQQQAIPRQLVRRQQASHHPDCRLKHGGIVLPVRSMLRLSRQR